MKYLYQNLVPPGIQKYKFYNFSFTPYPLNWKSHFWASPRHMFGQAHGCQQSHLYTLSHPSIHTMPNTCKMTRILRNWRVNIYLCTLGFPWLSVEIQCIKKEGSVHNMSHLNKCTSHPFTLWRSEFVVIGLIPKWAKINEIFKLLPL